MVKAVLGSTIGNVAQKTAKKQTSNVSKIKNNTTTKSSSNNNKKTTSTKSTTTSKKTTTKKNPTVKVNSSIETYDVLGTLSNSTSDNAWPTVNGSLQQQDVFGEIKGENTWYTLNGSLQQKTVFGDIKDGNTWETTSGTQNLQSFINNQNQKKKQNVEIKKVKTDKNTAQKVKNTVKTEQKKSNKKDNKKVEARLGEITGSIPAGSNGTTNMQNLVNQNQNSKNNKAKSNNKNKNKKQVETRIGKVTGSIAYNSNMSNQMQNLINQSQTTGFQNQDTPQKINNATIYGSEIATPGIGDFSYKEIKKDGFVTQGITETDKYYYVSAYSKDGEDKGVKSRIYLYDKTTGAYSGYIILNSIAHVGGITYDKDDGLIFVSGVEGTVDCLNYNNLNRAIEVAGTNASGCVLDLSNPSYKGSSIFVKCDISVKDKTHVGKASSVYYKNGKLYVTTFDGVNKGESVAFDVNYNAKKGAVTSKVSQKIQVPKQTQGFALTQYNGSQYMVTTQSISDSKSNVLVYKLNDDGSTQYQGKIYLEKGLEGIDIDDSGNIVAVYEKGEGNTYKSTMENLLKSISKYEDKEQEELATAAGKRYNNKRDISTIKAA